MTFVILSSFMLSVILQGVQSAHVVRCVNPNNDQGVCVRPESCFASKGIYIGRCPSLTDSACCLQLSCTSDLIQELERTRKKRSLRSPIFLNNDIMLSATIDSRCGWKSKETSRALSTTRSRSSQIVNSLKVNWEKNPYPWMLGLWVDQFSRVIPSCGAALISTKHAITAAHCIGNPKVNEIHIVSNF